MKPTVLLYFLLFIFVAGCNQSGPSGLRDSVLVPWNDSHIKAMGRINNTGPDHAILYWPGTSLKIHFYGEKVEAFLKDQHGENYYNVIIDGGNPVLFHPDTLQKWFVLADSLSKKEHTLEFFKRTEWANGNTWFGGFRITGKAKILSVPKTSERVIELFGNSITVGYADENYSGKDSPDSIYTNNYVTYGALTARHFNADYYCTARGGIGIMVSWFPLIMPEMYNRLDPQYPQSIWNFSRVQPNLVVINLFQNDSWLVNMPEYPEFRHRFDKTPPTAEQIIQAYYSFVLKIREVYPDASIICALGSMDATREGSPWPGYISKAVEKMDDPKVFTMTFPYMNKPGHPRVEDHRVMADTLIHFIDKHVAW